MQKVFQMSIRFPPLTPAQSHAGQISTQIMQALPLGELSILAMVALILFGLA